MASLVAGGMHYIKNEGDGREELYDIEADPGETQDLASSGHGRQMPSFWLRAGMWYLVTSQLSVILYGHLRVALMHGDLAVAHMIGVPFVFLLPLLLAGIGFPRGGSQQEWQAAATNTPPASVRWSRRPGGCSISSTKALPA